MAKGSVKRVRVSDMLSAAPHQIASIGIRSFVAFNRLITPVSGSCHSVTVSASCGPTSPSFSEYQCANAAVQAAYLGTADA